MNADIEVFPSTAWSKIWLACKDGSGSPSGAMNSLANAYDRPLRKLACILGMKSPDADDAVQEVMVELFSAKALGRLTPEKGRFRDYLHKALENKWLGHWRRAYQQRRDVRLTVPLDEVVMNQSQSVGALIAELDKMRAEECLEAVKQRIGKDFTAGPELFESLWQEMLHQKSESQKEMAEVFQLSPEAYRQRLGVLRRRFRKEFTTEVTKGIYDPADLKDEVNHLLGLISI